MAGLSGETDTIAAVATPPGTGGIGIVRISGPDAVRVADRLFRGTDGGRVGDFRSHTVHYGHVYRPQEGSVGPPRPGRDVLIDEGLLIVMRAPRSYTREDVVELQVHGGPVVLQAVLRAALGEGVRPAEPGEFTRRAFWNGRIDLTQAEAVLDVIRARSEAAARVSARNVRGELAEAVDGVRDALVEACAVLEAMVNFPEDVADAAAGDEAEDLCRRAMGRIEELTAGAEQGRRMRDGVRLVLCGRPNVGKSSLLNRLLRHPRAIVSDIPGTTRDTIEEDAVLGGLPFRIVDTAGILEPRDPLEAEAVRRSREQIAAADVVLFLIDAAAGLSPLDEALFSEVRSRRVVVGWNKIDLLPSDRPTEGFHLPEGWGGRPSVIFSVVTGEGMEQLESVLVRTALQGDPLPVDRILVTHLRHLQALEASGRAVRRAVEALEEDIPFECVLEELREAVRHLDRLTGRDLDIDLIDQIFSEFCIGK